MSPLAKTAELLKLALAASAAAAMLGGVCFVAIRILFGLTGSSIVAGIGALICCVLIGAATRVFVDRI